MKKHLFILLCSLSFSGILQAQNLDLNDLVKMSNMSIEKIDLLMKDKAYEKKVVQENKEFTIITYTQIRKEGGLPVMRSLHFGKRTSEKLNDIEFGVWQKKDALDFIDRLGKEGYKKTVKRIPDMGGGSTQAVSYRKASSEITYKEEQQGGGVTLYLFSISRG
jgi:hypothetical protein